MLTTSAAIYWLKMTDKNRNPSGIDTFYLIISYSFKKKKAFRFLNISIRLILVSMRSLKTLQDIIAHYLTPRGISVDLWYLTMSKTHTITGVVIVQILLETYEIFYLKLPQLLLIPT